MCIRDRDIISPLIYKSIDLFVRHIKYQIAQQHSNQVNDYKGQSIIALSINTDEIKDFSTYSVRLTIYIKFGVLFSKADPIVKKLLSYCNHCPNRLVCTLKPSAVENENDKKLLCSILKGTI